MKAQNFLGEVTDLLFPSRCLSCGSPGSVICPVCLEMMTCSISREEMDRAVEEIRISLGLDSLCAAALYGGVLRKLVLRLKNGLRVCAHPLSALMVAAVGNSPSFLLADLVTCVPSEKRKIAERGYNPAEELARLFAFHSGIPFANVLRKKHVTLDQDGLTRIERLKNVKGAFEPGTVLPMGSRVILVDDVLTTGATIRECSSALFESGAEYLCVLVAACAGPRIIF